MPASPWGLARSRLGGGHVVLDADGDEAVGARALPATDGRHGHVAFEGLRLLSRDVLLSDEPVVDAVVRADHMVAFVTARGVLHVWRSESGTQLIDTDVVAGISLSPDGTRVAYAKGNPPELDVFVARVNGSATAVVAQDPAPDYLPAFSPGGELLITSSRDGQPALWRVDRRGEVGRLSPRVDDDDLVGLRRLSTPDGREPPKWGAHGIAFFDGGGVVVLRDNGKLVGRIEGAHRFAWSDGGLLLEWPDGSAKIARIEDGR